MDTAGAADPGARQGQAGNEPWRRVAAVAGVMGLWELDFEEGTARIDEQVAAMYGRTLRTFGGSLSDFSADIHPNDRETVLIGTRAVATMGGGALELTYRVVRADGSVRWLLSRGRALPGGRLVGATVDLTDLAGVGPPREPVTLPAVWVVAGAPGAGKSTSARALCAALDPAPALLDKDTLFDGLAGAVLAGAGRPHDEREGPWYDEHVKVHEYAALTAAALEVRSAGCPVVLVAPFTTLIREPARWASWVHELGGEPVHLVWVHCDPATLRARIEQRGRAKDLAKLHDFDAFVARVQPDRPPLVPHLTVDTGAATPVPEQLRRLRTE